MNYVKSFDLFGVPATQIPATPGSGAPTTATEGAVGCLYMDTDTGNLYKCTGVADGVYTWEEVGGGDVKSINGKTPDENGNVEIEVGGLSTTAASLLIGILRSVHLYDGDQSGKITALAAELGVTEEEEPDTPVKPDDPVTPEVTLSSISATYTGGDVAVGMAVTALTGIVVTAHYSDGSTATVTGYTLSGTIAEGSNTITVSYGGKTTAFTVTGVAESGGEPVEVEMTTDTMVKHAELTVYSDEGTTTLDISNFNSPVPGHFSVDAFTEDTAVTITRSAMSSTTWKSLCIGEYDADNGKVLYNAVRVDDGFGQDNNAAQFNYTVHAGRKLVIIRRTGSLSWFTITVTK